MRFCLCVLAIGWVAMPSVTWEWSDKFANYRPGSDATPAWETTGIDWEVQAGRLTAYGSNRSFALPADAPHGKGMEVEATLVIDGRTTDGWKIAGLVLRRDDRNYWHLALVESPDGDGRRHYVELTEALDGQWLAQWAEGSRLTQSESVGADFDWQYGRPYRLRLEVGLAGIRGTVSELDGTLRARLAFLFDGPRAVNCGRPGLDSAGFRSAFDDFWARVDDVVEAPAERPAYPPLAVPGDPARRSGATGFFRVEQQDGCWWVFTPTGDSFYILGTDHVRYGGHWCEKLHYAPYGRVVERKYGGEAAWAEETLRRLGAWGFNTLTTGHSESLRYRGLPHTEFLSLGAGFAGLHPLAPRGNWTGFPNVFHPKWPAYCEKMARQQCGPRGDDPWLVGYFLDNELEWYGKPPEGHLLNWAMSKSAQDPAKQALVGFFRERHRSIAAFNRAWGTALPSFQALLERTELPAASTKTAERDREAFVELCAERYFAVAAAAIRTFDPHHLILGCRFAGQAPQGVWSIAGRYCDTISLNIYPRADLERGEVLGVEQQLQEAYRLARRPLMITEWSFPALDAIDSEGRPLPSRNGAGMRVDTQEQKTRACELMQRLLFRLPFIVGSDYFMWVDEPALGISSTFPEDSNYGLVSESDEPYELLTAMFARLNPQVYRLHGSEEAVQQKAAPKVSFDRGAPWHQAGARERVPIVVMAPDRLEEALITVPIEEGPAFELGRLKVRLQQRRSRTQRWLQQVKAVAAWDQQGRPVPVQLDRLGDGVELTVGLESLAQGESRTLFVYPAQAEAGAGALPIERNGNRLVVDNGVLRLVKEEADGDAWDRVELNGVPLGRFTPLIHQQVGQDLWIPPQRVAKIDVTNGPLRAVVEMVFEHRGSGGAMTTVGEGGVFRPQQQSPAAFRTAYRFLIYPRQNWFLAQFLWLENTDAREWRCADYFHYTPSFIGGSEEGDSPGGAGVPNYYLPFASWEDKQAGYQYGVIALREGDFSVQFWLDEGGRQHPDARREIGVTLRPNRRYEEPQPRLIVFGTSSGARPATLAGHLRCWQQVRSVVGELERR